MRSIFGWSLPPGCGKLPGEEDYPCAVCGLFEDNCICPICPKCENVGRPECYNSVESGGCGCIKSQAQIDSLAAQEKKWAEQNRVECEADERFNRNEEQV